MRAPPVHLALLTGFFLLTWVGSGWADQPRLPLKAGIIGLDAHALAWTKIINDPQATGELADMTVVAGFPGGHVAGKRTLPLGAMAELDTSARCVRFVP